MLSKYKSPDAQIQAYYLLPYQWFQIPLISSQNNVNQISQKNDFIGAFKSQISKMACFIQNIQKKEKQQIIDQVSQKLSFIHIDNFTLNPKLKTNTQWKILTEEDLKKKQTKFEFLENLTTIPFLLNYQQLRQQNSQLKTILVDQNYVQETILILFCSNSQNHLYMGYHQKSKISFQKLKKLINLLGYQQTHKTKAIFPQKNILKKFKLQQIKLDQQTNILMICDLRRYDQIQFIEENHECQKDLYFLPQHLLYENTYQIRNRMNEEDQITMADLDSQSRVISEHTLSTGAETPSFTSFLLDQQDERQVRTHNLFGQKKQEQIQIMREYARQVIHNQLIQIKNKQDVEFQLQKIAEQIQQVIYKKRYCKDPKDYKQLHYIKESIHYQNFYHKEQQNDKLYQ